MKKFLFFAAALLGLVACNNKGNEPINPGRQITLTATVDFGQGSNAPGRTVAPDTPAPTTADATVNFHWEKGDQVMLVSSKLSETQLFTIVDNSIQGDSASFTGTALTDMESYFVVYAGKNISKEFALNMLTGQQSSLELTSAANNYNIIAADLEGDDIGFKMNVFVNTLRLPLYGNGITLGSIKCYYNDGETTGLESTLNFDGGLALTDTPQEVWIPYGYLIGTITFYFYDTNGELIMEKKKVPVADRAQHNELITFPALYVQQAPE